MPGKRPANPQATAVFTYDPTAPALQTTLVDNHRGSAMFALPQFDVSMAGGGLQRQYRSESSVAGRTMGRLFDVISFRRSASTLDGAIPGSVPVDTELRFDDLQFDLGGFIQENRSGFAPVPNAMPVRLAWNGQVDAVGMFMSFVRTRGQTPLDLTLPSSLDPTQFDIGATISIVFDAVFTVDVDEADYLSFGDYVAARDWVDAHLRQLNVEWVADWRIDAVRSAAAPVPEPGTWTLAGLGLALIAGRARRRVSAPA